MENRPGRQRVLWEGAAVAYVLCAAISAVPLLAKLRANPYPAALAYLVGLLLLVAAMRPATRILAERPRAAVALVVVAVFGLAAVCAALYPRSRAGSAPSTAPDAMVEPVRELAAGHFAYDVSLRGGAPASPGVGWVVLNAPVTLSCGAWVLSAVWLAAAAGALGRRRPAVAAAFAVLLIATAHFLRLSIVGHDLFAATCAMVAVTAVAHPLRGAGWRTWWAAVGAGVVATARVPFVVFPVLLAGLLARRDRRAGIVFGAVSTITAVGLHGAMIAWAAAVGGWYQPLHVFDRATRAGPGPLLAGIVFWVVVAAITVRVAGGELSGWLLVLWVNFAVLFASEGIVELASSGWALRGWEGANYVAFPLPMLAASLAIGAAPRPEGAPTRP